ncbi:hypothetical protein SRHO_G00246810 [Serrasalmus rhombeus]
MKGKLIWDEEADKAFEDIKIDLCTAPALANPDYSKIFQLYVAVRNGYVNAVLAQEHNKQSRPIAYFSSQLDKIEQGMSPCYQGLAAASYAYEKATSITIGHKVELFTNHALHTLLTSGSFVLTNARRTGAPDVLRPVTSEGPDQQPPHAAADGVARDQPAAGPSGISRPVTRSITRATPPDDEDSD